MGDLIVMTRPSHSARRESLKDASAEILFFTGVRYMRVVEAETALASVTPPRGASKPRRRSAKSANAKAAGGSTDAKRA